MFSRVTPRMLRALARAAALSAAALSAAATLAGPVQADELRLAVEQDLPALTALYRALHQKPELSFQEKETARRMAAQLRAAGVNDVTERVGGTGVVGVLRNGDGPTVLVRADMDALPVHEETGLPYASSITAVDENGVSVPVMHACGHDIHMSVWSGVARQLAARRAQWSGTVVLVAQPAEERGGGAAAMLADGLFNRFPRPQLALALHDSASLPAGTIGIAPGYVLASVDSVDIVVRGQGGHGAYPHTARDPVVLAARIVTALQTLVARENNPLEPAVVTVGSIHGGTKHNIIPDEVRLQLTVRAYAPAVRQALLDGIARIARGEAIAAGMPEALMPLVSLAEKEPTPATWNTPALAERLSALFTSRFGADRVVRTQPVMAGEDFSRYRLADPTIQSLIFWVGGVPLDRWQAAQANGTHLPALHSAQWAPDAAPAIATGVEAMTAAVLDLLRPGSR